MTSDVQGATEASIETPVVNGTGKPAKAKAKAKSPVKAKNAKATTKKASAKAPTKKATAKTPSKAKTKSKAAPTRDPAKLDQFGLRKGSVKSRAAALYARAKGATLNEVKDEVGSIQFNVIGELESKGFKVTKTEEQPKGGGRKATRYKLHPKS